MALRSKRQQNHAMLITGYYGPRGNERPNTSNYDRRPNGENECKNCAGEQTLPLAESTPNFDGPAQENIPLQEAITETAETPSKIEDTIQKGIQKPKKQTPKDSDEDDSWPALKPQTRGQQPFFNFFPIMFGGYDSLGRSGGGPGGATAIANSFSTGKGGIASSSATAYGDPTSYLRNGNYGRN